jgi:hypothetical protein
VRLETWSAIASLKKRGCAIVVVDKKLNGLDRVAERMVVPDVSRVAWSGPSMLCNDLALQQRYLGVQSTRPWKRTIPCRRDRKECDHECQTTLGHHTSRSGSVGWRDDS